MNANAYDFDKTIYRHDSTVMFYLWCVARYPAIICSWPRLIATIFLYKAGQISRYTYMERFYEYLSEVPDPSVEAERFWKRQIKNVSPWYQKVRKPDDVIVSASPYFVVKPAAEKLGIRRVVCSPLNPNTGKYDGERCFGEGKVRALRRMYPDISIDDFYSDSLRDTPMAKIAKRAFLVRGETIEKWPRLGLAERNRQI